MNPNKIVIEKAETYHATKAISSTMLRKMGVSPRHYLEYATNPDQKESSPAQKRGTFFHDLLLEQNVGQYIARPVKEDGSLLAVSTKEYKAWAETIGDKIPIHPNEFKEMNQALSAFVANKEAMKLYDGAKIENSIYAVDHETGLKIKARPDIWGKNVLVDLKSAGSLQGNYFEKSIFQQGYDIQLAFYSEVIFAATSETISDFYILAFEASAPFESKIFKINNESMKVAKALVRQYLNKIKVCSEDNAWPGYVQEIIEIGRPAYLENNDEVIFGEVV